VQSNQNKPYQNKSNQIKSNKAKPSRHSWAGTCVVLKGPGVAAEGRGESPCCWGTTPLGELLPCGIPLGLPCDVVRKAMCWRKLTSSSAIAAAPSLSFCCSAYADRRDHINTHCYRSAGCQNKTSYMELLRTVHTRP